MRYAGNRFGCQSFIGVWGEDSGLVPRRCFQHFGKTVKCIIFGEYLPSIEVKKVIHV